MNRKQYKESVRRGDSKVTFQIKYVITNGFSHFNRHIYPSQISIFKSYWNLSNFRGLEQNIFGEIVHLRFVSVDAYEQSFILIKRIVSNIYTWPINTKNSEVKLLASSQCQWRLKNFKSI